MLTKRSVLVEARGIIALPKNWTQQAYAKDSDGNRANWNDKNATCFCATGCVKRAVINLDPTNPLRLTRQNRGIYDKCIDALEDLIYHPGKDWEWMIGSLVFFNDARERQHSEVLDLFDKAIEACDG